MTLSYSDVAEIVKIVDSSNCDEVSLELEGAKILIRRKGAGAPAAETAPSGASPTPAAAQQQAAPAPDRPETAAPGGGEAAAVQAEGNKVCSPMVGTFYARPSPDEPEFVTVGSDVEIGQPLCIIEVMKLFTTIEATRAGKVTAVLAENGQMVEYGQPLFVIE